LHVLRQRGEVEVVGLLATITEREERISMQGIRVELLHAQARATSLPVIEARIPYRASNALYERSLAEALGRARLRWPGIAAIAFGDLFLADIRAYRESLFAPLGWTSLFPLFGSDTTRLAHAMLDGGLRARLSCVDTTQLDAAFAGRAFDAALLADLPADVDPCGERGEFHTCVHAGPMFAEPLAIERGDTVLRDDRFACTDFAFAG
jgi:diphthamide synthase (EF-2-diphthine--ammonia ligase)